MIYRMAGKGRRNATPPSGGPLLGRQFDIVER